MLGTAILKIPIDTLKINFLREIMLKNPINPKKDKTVNSFSLLKKETLSVYSNCLKILFHSTSYFHFYRNKFI